MSEALYFIAVVPPESIQNEITDLKHLVAQKFGSQHALKSPPHITLHMPFKWKDKKWEQLAALMEDINSDIRPFEVEIRNFDFFEPRVVFVNVLESEALGSLQHRVVDHARKELKLDNSNYKDKPFHPHVTIGFRDLRKKMFHEAKTYFERQKIHYSFTVERVELLKHDGTRWNILA